MPKAKKYQSPSTSSVQHDISNFIVEAILINRHGALAEASWRKGMPHAVEWGRLLTLVRRITNTLKVSAEQVAWFIHFYKITDVNYEDFGLLRWKIQKYFRWVNLQKFTQYYIQLHQQLIGTQSSYVENTTGYVTKETTINRKKTLSEILQELEANDGKGNGQECSTLQEDTTETI